MEALNQKERSFAEENHGLIYAFLNYYKLPEAEYYDICAIAYLHAVTDRRKDFVYRKRLFLRLRRFGAGLATGRL